MDIRPTVARTNTSVEGNDTSALGLYLRDVGRRPLLTAEQEIAYAQAITRGRSAHDRLRHGDVPPEEREILEREDLEGQIAFNRFVEANLRLVIAMTRKYSGWGLPREDLIQEGNLGLMDAVTRWDPGFGCRFSSYATWWVRQRMTRALRKGGRLIRLPVQADEALIRLARLSGKLYQDLGREPTREELARALGLPLAKVERLLRSAQSPLSLESLAGDETENALEYYLPSEDPNPEELIVDLGRGNGGQDLKAEVAQAMAILNAREFRVLELRYGLQDNIDRTLDAVGQVLQLTRERIRQIEQDALGKLRDPGAWQPRTALPESKKAPKVTVPRSTKRRSPNDDQCARVFALTQEPPPSGSERWTYESLAQELTARGIVENLSVNKVRNILRTYGVRLKAAVPLKEHRPSFPKRESAQRLVPRGRPAVRFAS